jgi:hypothetical protein
MVTLLAMQYQHAGAQTTHCCKCRLRDRDDPRLLELLEAENAATSRAEKGWPGFEARQRQLTASMAGMVPQHEVQAPELGPGPAWFQKRRVAYM